MQHFTAQVRAQSSLLELREVLTRIVTRPALHARLVNTLSRMEYIGVRKMLKARHADLLDQEGLLHVIEEASHALRLKRAAIQLNGGSEAGVATYCEGDTLAGHAGEAYMQGVDRACEELLADFDLAPEARSEANYLLSTAAIEIRAEVFYPVYEECLRAAEAPFSVSAILKDELRHLAEVQDSLSATFPGQWMELVELAVVAETKCFESWLSAVRDASLASRAT